MSTLDHKILTPSQHRAVQYVELNPLRVCILDYCTNLNSPESGSPQCGPRTSVNKIRYTSKSHERLGKASGLVLPQIPNYDHPIARPVGELQPGDWHLPLNSN